VLDGYGSGAGNLTMRSARGTKAAPTPTQAADTLGAIAGFGYGATGYSAGGRALITLRAAENWTDTAQGTQIALQTTTPATTTLVNRVMLGLGLMVQDASGASPTGGDMGAGTINTAGAHYINGTALLSTAGGTITGNLTVSGQFTVSNQILSQGSG